MGSSQTTSKTEIPEPSLEELENLATESALIEALIMSQGFEMNKENVTEFENPAKVEALEEQQLNLQDRAEQLRTDIAEITRRGGSTAANDARAELRQIDNELKRVNNDLAGERDKTKTDVRINLRKSEDPRVKDLREQGRTDEANALKAELADKQLEQLNKKDEVDALFLDAAKKFLSGDLSITEQQEAELEASVGRIREPVLNAINQIEQQVLGTQESVIGELEREEAIISEKFAGIADAMAGVEDRIAQTGLSTEEAFLEAEARARQTGADLFTALDESVAASQALIDQNMFKLTRDLRAKTNTQQALLGRRGMDPAFMRELNEQVVEASRDAQLNLAVMETSGKLDITERTGRVLQDIAGARTQFATQQGRRLEDVQLARVDQARDRGEDLRSVAQRRAAVRESTGLRLEDVSRSRAALDESLLRAREQQRFALAQGLPLQQIQAAPTIQGTLAAPGQQQFANLASATGLTQGSLNRQAQLRMAQPTVTQTSTPSFGEVFLSGLGVAAQGAGSVLGGIGKLRGA